VNIIVPEGATELTAALNDIIAAMLEDGFIEELSVNHIGQ
jgi:ABC-type amino acid transport substrate-binding protein